MISAELNVALRNLSDSQPEIPHRRFDGTVLSKLGGCPGGWP
jgi:hypothetical protein